MRRKLCLILVASCLMAVSNICNADPLEPDHASSRLPSLMRPSETKGNIGYQVGGGTTSPHFGEPRRVEEGTWGWDYQGWLLPRRVISTWWHGRRYQGGTGAYQTDGPQLYHDK